MARKDRDTEEELKHNLEVFTQIDSMLEHHIPFCLFPEGRHRPMHSLMPFKRGLATLGFQSASKRPTYILPIGLDYSDWFHFRGYARVTIGEPLNVNDFASSLSKDVSESQRDHLLQEELQRRLSSLIFYLPDDEYYEPRLAEAEACRKRPSVYQRTARAFLAFPPFVIAAVLTLPLWALSESLCSRLKDKAFNNTIRFGVKFVGTPLWGLILAGLLFVFLPWWLAAPIMLLYIPSFSFFYDWLNIVQGRCVPPLK